MNTTFTLSIVENSVLKITDTTQQAGEYLSEDNNNYVIPGKIKYSDACTVNVISYKSSNQQEQLIETIITPHVQDGEILELDEAYHNLTKDGHYLVKHFIIPTVTWLDEQMQQPGNDLQGMYEYIYVSDGYKFYKLVDQKLEECDVQEILEVNANLTTISQSEQETFSVCFLHKCYLNLCKTKFEKMIKQRCFTKYDQDFNIDLIWMGINAIKINTEFGYLSQAQSVLEDLVSCNTLCSQNIFNLNNYEPRCCN